MIKIHFPTEAYGFIEIEIDEPREKAVEVYQEIKRQWEEAKEQKVIIKNKHKDDEDIFIGDETIPDDVELSE